MEIKVGIWKRTSKKGNKYCSGKFKLDGKEYFLTLFNNDKKGNEKAPDFNLIIRDSINTQENNKQNNKGQKNIELGQDKVDVSQVYADFGNMTEDDFPEDPF